MIRILNQNELPDVKVTTDRLWCLAGYDDPGRAPPIIQKIFQSVMEMGPGLLEPKACYDIFPLKEVTDHYVCIDSICFESRDLAKRFQKARELAILLVTIGLPLEHEVERLYNSGDAGVGCFLDLFGSAAVDQVAYKAREVINEEVRLTGYEAMSSGYCIGKTCPAYTDCGGVVAYWLAPGYADLATKEQKKVFTLLDGGKIGVHLSDSCMMTPRKSYTCLLPIGPQTEKVSNRCEEGQTEWITIGSLRQVAK